MSLFYSYDGCCKETILKLIYLTYALLNKHFVRVKNNLQAWKFYAVADKVVKCIYEHFTSVWPIPSFHGSTARFMCVWPVSAVQELFIDAQLVQRCMHSFLTRHQHVTWR